MSKVVDNYIKSLKSNKQMRYDLSSMYRYISTEDLIVCKQEIDKQISLRNTSYSESERASMYLGLSNFMAGVAQALSCKALLRGSKGHIGFGIMATGGEMWSMPDIIQAYNWSRGAAPFNYYALSWLNKCLFTKYFYDSVRFYIAKE